MDTDRGIFPESRFQLFTRNRPETDSPNNNSTADLVAKEEERDPSDMTVEGVNQNHNDNDLDPRFKRPKVPKGIKKARRNRLLCRLIQPKPALMLLHELKPGLVFKVSEPPSQPSVGGSYSAEAIHCGKVWGTGTGVSKNAAKHRAAELALKQIVKETMDDPQFLTTLTTAPESKEIKDDDESMDADTCDSEEVDTPYEKLPWATLASFALHRMFADWKMDGVIVAPPSSKQVVIPNRISVNAEVNDGLKLPENPELMHPVSLLNQMHPGIRAEELQRTTAPNSSVTVGYRIAGQLYTGTATNGKAARKIAATHACMSVYGVKFT